MGEKMSRNQTLIHWHGTGTDPAAVPAGLGRYKNTPTGTLARPYYVGNVPLLRASASPFMGTGTRPAHAQISRASRTQQSRRSVAMLAYKVAICKAAD